MRGTGSSAPSHPDAGRVFGRDRWTRCRRSPGAGRDPWSSSTTSNTSCGRWCTRSPSSTVTGSSRRSTPSRDSSKKRPFRRLRPGPDAALERELRDLLTRTKDAGITPTTYGPPSAAASLRRARLLRPASDEGLGSDSPFGWRGLAVAGGRRRRRPARRLPEAARPLEKAADDLDRDVADAPPSASSQVPVVGQRVSPGFWAYGWALDDSGIDSVRVTVERGARRSRNRRPVAGTQDVHPGHTEPARGPRLSGALAAAGKADAPHPVGRARRRRDDPRVGHLVELGPLPQREVLELTTNGSRRGGAGNEGSRLLEDPRSETSTRR